MSAQRHHGRLAIVVPALAGLGLLGGGLLLLPDRREVIQAQRRAAPPVPAARRVGVATPVPPMPVAPPPPPPLPPPPSIAAAIRTADAAQLAALTVKMIAAGQAVTTQQVAYDLVAKGRPAVALAYLAARPDGAGPPSWRLRIDLLRQSGRHGEAVALVAGAARTRTGIAPADLTAAAYAANRPDLLITAAANGAIPPPDAALALDLARRADATGRGDLIALLDRTTRADWRAADPWLAIRVATRGRDTAAALRAADRLPVAQRDAARETILTTAGDRAGMRALLLGRAAQPGARIDVIAEQLLAAGYRDDAEAVLRRAAIGQPATSPATRRLLYLMGPRPSADDLGWLRQQAQRGSAAEQAAWLAIYADRDRPNVALAFLARHPLAAHTDVMLMRLQLAKAAGNDGVGRDLAAKLLDGRPLDAVQLRQLAAAMPETAGATQANAIAQRRIAAGVAEPRDAIDLAWAAWNAGDAAGAARWLRAHLTQDATDLPALRLMADVQARTGGERAARPWLERALAQTPQDSRARVELLDRLGRRADALALVERLRADAPQDRSLVALNARLLIAQGQPGRARTMLAQ